MLAAKVHILPQCDAGIKIKTKNQPPRIPRDSKGGSSLSKISGFRFTFQHGQDWAPGRAALDPFEARFPPTNPCSNRNLIWSLLQLLQRIWICVFESKAKNHTNKTKVRWDVMRYDEWWPEWTRVWRVGDVHKMSHASTFRVLKSPKSGRSRAQQGCRGDISGH